MEPFKYVVKNLQFLKVGLVARESLLNELGYKIHKAKKIFGKYDPEVMDSRVFYESQQQFLAWLDRYIQNGIRKVKALDDCVESGENKLFYNATMVLDGGEPVRGIFIPVPTVTYDDMLQEFKTTKTQGTCTSSRSDDSNLSVKRRESERNPRETELNKSEIAIDNSKSSRIYRSVSLINLEYTGGAGWEENEQEMELHSNPSEASQYSDPAMLRKTLSHPDGDCQRTSGSLPGIYVTPSGTSSSSIREPLETESSLEETHWNMESSTRCIPRPTSAIPPTPPPELEASLDDFEVAMSNSVERIRSTISDFQQFVDEMGSQGQLGVMPTQVRSLENLESTSRYLTTETNSEDFNVTTRKSSSDTSVLVTFQGSLHKQPPGSKSICPLEFHDWPQSGSNRSSFYRSSCDELLQDAVQNLREELSGPSLGTSKNSVSRDSSYQVKSHENACQESDAENSDDDEASGVADSDEQLQDFGESMSEIAAQGDEFGCQEINGNAVSVRKKLRGKEKNIKETLERKWMEEARRSVKQDGSGKRNAGRIPVKVSPPDPRPVRPLYKPEAIWKNLTKKVEAAEAPLVKEAIHCGTWKTSPLRRQSERNDVNDSEQGHQLEEWEPCKLAVTKIARVSSPRLQVLDVKDGGTWRPNRTQPEPPADRGQLIQLREPFPKLYERKPELTYAERANRRQEVATKIRDIDPIPALGEPFPAPYTRKPVGKYGDLQKKLISMGERPFEIEKTLKAERIRIPVQNVQINVPPHVVPPKKKVPAVPKKPLHSLARKTSRSAPCAPRKRTLDQPHVSPLAAPPTPRKAQVAFHDVNFDDIQEESCCVQGTHAHDNESSNAPQADRVWKQPKLNPFPTKI